MTDRNDTTAPSSQRRPGLGVGLRRLLLGAAFAVTFVAGGLVMSGPPASAFTMAVEEAGMGGMHAMHGMHGHGDMHGMMQAHIDKMLTAVDATPEQKERIKTILHKGFESMAPLHQKLADTHADLHKLITAPTIDRSALEQLRSARIADLDQASKTMVETIADAAEVLRPEQRAKLGALMAEHHHQHR